MIENLRKSLEESNVLLPEMTPFQSHVYRHFNSKGLIPDSFQKLENPNPTSHFLSNSLYVAELGLTMDVLQHAKLPYEKMIREMYEQIDPENGISLYNSLLNGKGQRRDIGYVSINRSGAPSSTHRHPTGIMELYEVLYGRAVLRYFQIEENKMYISKTQEIVPGSIYTIPWGTIHQVESLSPTSRLAIHLVGGGTVEPNQRHQRYIHYPPWNTFLAQREA